MKVPTFVLVAAYVLAAVLANLSVVVWGPSVTILNAFLLIGLDITLRDRLHDAWQGRHLALRMGGLIALGSLVSWLINRNAGPVALASLAAFAASGLADTLIYHLLRTRPWLTRVNGSNLAGAAADSLVFPTLAFGGLLWPVVLGQFVAKVLGGWLWSLVLQRMVPPARARPWGARGLSHWLHGQIIGAIAWYLQRKCGGASHVYPYGEQGRYVVLMNETQYHHYDLLGTPGAQLAVPSYGDLEGDDGDQTGWHIISVA